MSGGFRNTSVLVTGGAGFIGSHLVDALVEDGARVRVLDNFTTGSRANLSHLDERIEIQEGDIRNSAICRSSCSDVEVVFHQAALGSVPRSIEDPATSLEVNVTGTANVFAAARDAKVRRVVYASSSSVYGDSKTLPKREGEEGEPLSPYAASKRMNEETAAVFRRCYELELIGLRYFNVYGPRQDPRGPYAAVIPKFFHALLQGKRPKIFGDGEQSRDFTAVADAVQANLLAGLAPSEASGNTFNVATGRRTTVMELAERVGRALGLDIEPELQPPRQGDVRHSLADISRARDALGFEPRIDLEDGLEGCIRYYQRLFADSTVGS
jgi:nucleoside-diphosphate-sugar epimerase